jgi:hypothetical protein
MLDAGELPKATAGLAAEIVSVAMPGLPAIEVASGVAVTVTRLPAGTEDGAVYVAV